MHRITLCDDNDPTLNVSSDRIIDVLKRMCSSDQPITFIMVLCCGEPGIRIQNRRKEICLFLLNQFKDTLCEIDFQGIELNPDIQDAITQCSCIKSINLWESSLPYPITAPAASNTDKMIIRFATALPNLVDLTLDSDGINGKVSGTQLCNFITYCPRITTISLRLDNSFDDGCLRFLAQNAPNLINLHLQPCQGVRGEEIWVEGDVRWQNLIYLNLGAISISPLFLEQVLSICTKLQEISLGVQLPLDKMKQYGFSTAWPLAYWRDCNSVLATSSLI